MYGSLNPFGTKNGKGLLFGLIRKTLFTQRFGDYIYYCLLILVLPVQVYKR